MPLPSLSLLPSPILVKFLSSLEPSFSPSAPSPFLPMGLPHSLAQIFELPAILNVPVPLGQISLALVRVVSMFLSSLTLLKCLILIRPVWARVLWAWCSVLPALLNTANGFKGLYH